MENFILTPKSSNISKFGYNEREQILTVQFRDEEQSTYDYYEVPENVFVNMQMSNDDPYDSVGKCFNGNVKGKFRYDKRWK